MTTPISISMVATERLNPYAANSRVHTEAQIDKIAAAIKEFGFLNPVVVGDGTIIAGHARVRAAHKLGLPEVPTIDASYLTPEQRRAFVIADNRLAEDSTWNEDVLRAELHDLHRLGFNLSMTGMGENELSKLVKLSADYQPKLAPEQQSGVVTDDEVAKAKGRLEGRFADAGNVKMVAVTCPNCGHDFDVAERNL